jgi:hypothetical protein
MTPCRCEVCAKPGDPFVAGLACIHEIKRDCPFCGGSVSDGMVVHSWRCEWCTTVQRVARIDDTLQRLVEGFEFLMAMLTPAKESNAPRSESIPDTQRSQPERRGRSVYLGAGFSLWEGDPGAPPDCPEPHPDSRPTEPSCAPDPGADAADSGPE